MKLLCIVFLLSTLCFSAQAKESNDYEYKIGMAYLSGAKGETKSTKIIPKCAYDRCKGLTKQITITKKDYKKALYWLDKSVDQGYVPAAQKAYELLYKQINYKQKVPNEYLLKMMKKRFDLNIDQYYFKIHKYIKLMKKSNNCKANYYLFKIYQHGYYRINKNSKLLEQYKEKVAKNCPKNSYYQMAIQF